MRSSSAAVADPDQPFALSGTIEPTCLSTLYRAGLVAVAVGMLLLPFLYLMVIVGAAAAVWWHVTAVRAPRVFGLAVLATVLSSAACREAAGDVSLADARAEAEAWRIKHEADYRAAWVTIAGLHFLDAGTYSVGSAPSNDIVLDGGAPTVLGRVTLDGDAVRLEPDASADVRMKGQRVTTSIVLTDDIPGPADELTAGGIRMVIHQSGTRKSLRIWNPEGGMAKGFLGFSWFEIQPDYRVVGRFIPDAQPRTLQVINTFGDLDDFTTEGVVEFALQGRTLRLRAFTTPAKRLYFVFKDESSGAETYGAARFLYADLRDDGTTVLDFNQAYNPPCAFNPYTTCPIPLPENRLPMKVLAGEKAYPVHVTLPGA